MKNRLYRVITAITSLAVLLSFNKPVYADVSINSSSNPKEIIYNDTDLFNVFYDDKLVWSKIISTDTIFKNGAVPGYTMAFQNGVHYDIQTGSHSIGNTLYFANNQTHAYGYACDHMWKCNQKIQLYNKTKMKITFQWYLPINCPEGGQFDNYNVRPDLWNMSVWFEDSPAGGSWLLKGRSVTIPIPHQTQGQTIVTVNLPTNPKGTNEYYFYLYHYWGSTWWMNGWVQIKEISFE